MGKNRMFYACTCKCLRLPHLQIGTSIALISKVHVHVLVSYSPTVTEYENTRHKLVIALTCIVRPC